MTNPLDLPPDLVAKLDARVASGAAADAIEVVRDGLAALEAEDSRKLEAVRAKIARALSDPRSSTPANEAFDRIDRVLEALDRA